MKPNAPIVTAPNQKSLEEIVDNMDQLFGLEKAQRRIWNDLHTLKKVTKIEDEHKDDARFQFLKRQYEKEDRLEPHSRRVVSVLNAMFTQGRAVIVIDRDNVRSICKLDSNWQAILGLANDEYRAFLKVLYSHGVFECVVDGKKGKGPSIIKMNAKSAEIFGFDVEEVERQLKATIEFVERGSIDAPTDKGSDKEGSSQKEEESGRKVEAHRQPLLYEQKKPKEEKEPLVKDLNKNPLDVWSEALAKITPHILQKSGFTKATISAFETILKESNLPLVSISDFEMLLDEKVLKIKFHENAKNENFRFGSPYCQEMKVELLSRFKAWHKSEDDRIQNSPEVLIEKFPFPSVFVDLCELADHFSCFEQVRGRLLVGLEEVNEDQVSVDILKLWPYSSDLDLLKILMAGYRGLQGVSRKLLFRRRVFRPIFDELETRYRNEIYKKFGPIDPETLLSELEIGKRLSDWRGIAKNENDADEYIEYIITNNLKRKELISWPPWRTSEDELIWAKLVEDEVRQSS